MSAANASDIANAANVGPAPANPPVPAQALFALLPARAITDVINYSLSEGIKIYIKETSALPNLFNLSPESLFYFLNSVKERGEVENWDDLFIIPDAKQVDRNLITQFGMLTRKEVKSRDVSYHSQNNRKYQNVR